MKHYANKDGIKYYTRPAALDDKLELVRPCWKPGLEYNHTQELSTIAVFTDEDHLDMYLDEYGFRKVAYETRENILNTRSRTVTVPFNMKATLKRKFEGQMNASEVLELLVRYQFMTMDTEGKHIPFVADGAYSRVLEELRYMLKIGHPIADHDETIWNKRSLWDDTGVPLAEHTLTPFGQFIVAIIKFGVDLDGEAYYVFIERIIKKAGF